MIGLPILGLKKEQIKYYDGDSGVDIHVPKGTQVVAADDMYIVYSEPGHTPWDTPPDTANSILGRLVNPVKINGISYYYVWYTHLSKLSRIVPDGSSYNWIARKGEVIGETGIGNLVPHLHFGVLVSRGQNSGEFMPPAKLKSCLDGVVDLVASGKYPEGTPTVIKVFIHDGIAKCFQDEKEIIGANMALEIRGNRQ